MGTLRNLLAHSGAHLAFSSARAGKIVIAVGKTLASLVSYRSASSKPEKSRVYAHAHSIEKSLDAYVHLALAR